MRGKSIWNIWTPIKWEQKLQNLNWTLLMGLIPIVQCFTLKLAHFCFLLNNLSLCSKSFKRHFSFPNQLSPIRAPQRGQSGRSIINCGAINVHCKHNKASSLLELLCPFVCVIATNWIGVYDDDCSISLVGRHFDHNIAFKREWAMVF